MNRQNAVTQAAFDSLLAWLDADREQAGKRYEEIRSRLIKIFTCRGRSDAEELADETINRVTLKAPNLVQEYVGNPALYFYGVAHKVYLEALRKHPTAPLPETPAPRSAESEREYECLDECMERLPAESRELILGYYQDDKRAKIDRRKEMALRLGIGQNALRIRAHRIRLSLEGCVQGCLAEEVAA